MRKVTLILLVIILTTSVFAQKIKIEGKVVDVTEGKPVHGVNINLQTIDSVFSGGTTTDSNGKFELLHIQSGDYILNVNALGFRPVQLVLKNTQASIDLKEIKLEQTSVSLSDVTVIGKNSSQKVDRLIVIPTASQLKVASNSFDLLSQIVLPSLNVDIVNRKITANLNGKVELRINGIKVTQSEIEVLKSTDIIRVEYYEHPGVRFGMTDAVVVIDFITLRPVSGMLFMTDLQNAYSTGFGNDNLSMKINRKKSEFGIIYSTNYREYANRYVDMDESYLLSDNILNRQTTGFKTPFGYQDHNINISYNLTDEDKYVFNVVFRNEFYQRHSDDISSMIISNDPNPYKNDKTQKNSYYHPSFDLDYSLQIGKKQNIELNLVTNYLKTNYKYNYVQTAQLDTLNTQYALTNEQQESLTGELAYNLQLSNSKLSAGIKQQNIWDKNDYISNSQRVNGNTSFTYLYTQLTGTIKKISYELGLAGVNSRFNGSNQSYNFYALRPELDIQYSLNSLTTIHFASSISTSNPYLYMLNNIDLQLDNLTVLRGNPDLKPYKSYFNSISYSHQEGILTSIINFTQAYHANPIMDDVYYEKSTGRIINSAKNQKNLQLYWPSISLKTSPLFNKILTLNLSGNYLYYRSIGSDYNLTLQNFFLTGGATLSYRNYSMLMNARTRPQYLWGETITRDENSSSLQLQYNKDPFIIAIGMLYPLNKDWNAGSLLESNVARIDTWSHINDNGRMVYLKFSWNLSVGRKFNNGQKKLYNEGVQSGIMTAPE